MTSSKLSWLPQTSHDWPLTPIRYLFAPVKELAGSDHNQYQLLSLTLGGIVPRPTAGRGKNAANHTNYQIVKPGDLVICLFDYDLTTRTIGHVQQHGIIAGAYTILRPNPGVSSRFYYYFFLALDETKELLHLCTGPRNGLTKPTLLGLKIPQPCLSSQKAIATYLDQETAKIDDLITKQNQLLNLLEEKRRAIINHATNHGPAKRLSELFSVNDDTLNPNTNPSFKFDYVDISSVQKDAGIIKRERLQFATAPTRARRLVKPGDIIVSTIRPELETMALIDDNTAGVIASTAFAVLRPHNKTHAKYYYYALRSSSFLAQVAANSAGVTYPAIKPGQLMGLSISLPPKSNRAAIAQYLDREMDTINQLKNYITDQITLLKQRRTSLVSHAVRGGIQT